MASSTSGTRGASTKGSGRMSPGDSRNLCVVHNVTTRLWPELFLPFGDDVVVLVAGSVVDRSNSDCTASDRNVPQSQFPYGISISW